MGIKHLRPDTDQENERWFYSFDDTEEIDLFTDPERKNRIGLEIYARVQQRLSASRSHRLRPNRTFTWRKAAVLLVLVIAGVLIVRNYFFTSEKITSAVVFKEIKAGQGKIKKLQLSDGSVIYLQAGGILKIPESFRGDKREIYLIAGEAYFEITHDEEMPFMVHTGTLLTKVFGTTFNIEAYPGEQAVKISLLKGRVTVVRHDARNETPEKEDNYLLEPGQMLVFDKQRFTADVRAIASDDVAGWLKGKVVFNDILLTEAIARLENIYAVDIQYRKDILSGKRVTGEYSKESVDNILKAILLVHNLKVKRAKGGYHIFK